MGAQSLRVRLLGAMDLQLGEQRLQLDSARAESLLAYLLLHRDTPQSRQRVAFQLWPDSTEQQAHTNLRKVLYNLRRALPGSDRWLEIGPRTLQWRAGAPLWLDVEYFERALTEGRLGEAVDTYTGELLEGRSDEWLVSERERLAALYLEALERLARQHERGRRWAEAIRCAEQVVAHDPLREEGHRLLIRLCHAAGDRARAVRAYHVCASTLERDLGIEPSPETRATYESLVAAAPAGSGPPAAPAGLPAVPGGHRRSPGLSPFTGRASEQAQLAAVWQVAAGGRAELVLITGEAGIGKTRLAEELRARTRAVTVGARAYPAEGPLAYGVVAAWLRSRPVAARLPRLDPPRLIELARLLPELAAHMPPPEPLPQAELRGRLFSAIASALLSAGAPLLLIADDAQWADTQTLQVIHYLLRTAPTAPLLVAATARREELDEGHPLTALTRAVQAQGRFTEVQLDRLGRGETALLAERITGVPLDPVALERLYGDSEGNPLFVVEALKPDAPAVSAAKVEAVIGGRLARLSQPAALAAETAAAIGRAFTADVLGAAAGLDGQVFVSALDELWRRGIIRAHGPSFYDFSHARIRDAAYARLSPPRRRQAHLAVARALEHSENPAAAAIALQYENAGSTAEAIRWHERAAEAAQWLHAHGEAVRALERALALSEDLPPGPGTARLQLRLLTALPAPLIANTGFGAGRMNQVHERALQLAAQLGVDPEPPLLWSLAFGPLTRGEWEPAQEMGVRLRTRAERDDDQVLWVESDYIRGIAAYWPGRLAEARGHFEAAMRRFSPARRRAHVLRFGQDPELIVRLRLAHTLWLLGHPREADLQRDLALAAITECTHAYSRATTWLWAAIVAMDRGDAAEFRHCAQAVQPYAADDAPAQVVLPAEMFAGYLDVLDGQIAAGLSRVAEVRERIVSRQAPAPGLPGVATRLLLQGYAIAGEATAGLSLAGEALGMGRGAELWEAEFRRLRAVFLAALGAPAGEVTDELERALAVARRQQAHAFEQRIRETLAERSLSHGGAR
jgi:DNA-binding SARP family transcriptional activator